MANHMTGAAIARHVRRRLVGFTLIELLVVISIISLLISLLLPALSSAKQAGLTTQCLANLRQIGTGISSYVVTYNGWLPHSYNATDRYWYNQLQLVDPTQLKTSLVCPASEFRWGDFPQYKGNYAWNIAAGPTNTPYKYEKFRQHAKAGVIADAGAPGAPYIAPRCTPWFGSNNYTTHLRMIHPKDKGFNLLYLDGHADQLHLDAVSADTFMIK